jgi:hypothetical protein
MAIGALGRKPNKNAISTAPGPQAVTRNFEKLTLEV